jgi:hydroxyethylthiazole kinase-like uncharacterized protein yjeF
MARNDARGNHPARGRALTPALLRTLPLTTPDGDDGKEERGRVLIIAGGREVPGAALLAATAAMRAGAGKLQIATARSVAPAIAIAMPEARVIALPESRAGEIAATLSPALRRCVQATDAVLIGPGMLDERAAGRLATLLLPHLGDARLVVDAGALTMFATAAARRRARESSLVLTPHAGEMATLQEQLRIDAVDAPTDARTMAHATGCAVIAKAATSWIAATDGALYRHAAALAGLGTSGSGDVLAGLIAGIAAREPDLLRAALWAVHLHARAGARLARRRGAIGFLARELAAEVPALLARRLR